MRKEDITCPICQGRSFADITVRAKGLYNQSAYVSLIVKGGFKYLANARRFMCKTCGYVLDFFDKEDIDKITAYFEKDK